MLYRKLSIVVPLYNEEKTILEVLLRLKKVRLPLEMEVIVVDDGSHDKSGELARNFVKRNKKNFWYIHKINGGKGSAVRLGLRKATGDIFTVQDADLEYDPSEYAKLIQLILNGQTQVVYGSRYITKRGHLQKAHHATYLLHLVGNWGLSLLTSIFFMNKITDMETCYKMFTREVFESMKLKGNGFDIEPEITAKILRNGYKIKELKIHYLSRDFNEGKKITWRDGLKACGYLIYYRFFN